METSFHWNESALNLQKEVIDAIRIKNNIKDIGYSYWINNGIGLDGAGITIIFGFRQITNRKSEYVTIMCHFDKLGHLIIDEEIIKLLDKMSIAEALQKLRHNYPFIMDADKCPHLYDAIRRYRV